MRSTSARCHAQRLSNVTILHEAEKADHATHFISTAS